MEVSITLGWWLLPTAITIAALAFPFLPNDPPRGWHNVGDGIVGMFQLFIGVIVSLAAWLIWSLLK